MTWILPERERLVSPNRNAGRWGTTPDLLVLHYTAGGGSAVATARGFADPGRDASAHFVVGREGDRMQCVPLSDTAWHAGDSGKSWLPPEGVGTLAQMPEERARVVNRRSVGIEICNLGWQADVAKSRGFETMTARHRNPRSKSERWEVYPGLQVDAVRTLAALLRMTLPSLRFVCGHEDVTHYSTTGKGSKLDPGPAFPWHEIEWAALGYTRVLYDFETQAWVADGEETTAPIDVGRVT